MTVAGRVSALVTVALVHSTPLPARAESRVDAGLLVDLRAARTDETRSWLEGSLGKTRYGDGTRSDVYRLSQASVLLGADLGDAFAARVQVNLDLEPGADDRGGVADVVEAYVRYNPALSPSFRLSARGGMFFPPVSLENQGPAWTPVYTITPSAVNTWIGEEVRATGAELTLGVARGDNEVSALGGVFGWNDPAGSVLAWRGWALHDRQTGRPDKLPLAPLPTIGPGSGMFELQPFWARPVQEVDDRPGFYAGTAVKLGGRLQVRAMRWENRADETLVIDDQYGWRTRLSSAGLSLALPGGFDVLGQYLRADSIMGRMPDGTPAVGIEAWAAYGLVTWAWGRHRITGRYDRFDVDETDALPLPDDNSETGSAWTAAYALKIAERHRIAVEVLSVESTRPARAYLRLAETTRETILQASLRLDF